MKNLASFLKPKRKPNLKFKLSDAFVDEKGNVIEWEMRQLSAEEGMKLSVSGESDYRKIMTQYVAESLVFPDLHDKELLDGLSEREGRKIFDPVEALKLLTTDAELAELIDRYVKHNSLITNFNREVEEAKN